MCAEICTAFIFNAVADRVNFYFQFAIPPRKIISPNRVINSDVPENCGEKK